MAADPAVRQGGAAAAAGGGAARRGGAAAGGEAARHAGGGRRRSRVRVWGRGRGWAVGPQAALFKVPARRSPGRLRPRVGSDFLKNI